MANKWLTVIARDENSAGVAGVLITINGNDEGLTGSDGSFSILLPENTWYKVVGDAPPNYVCDDCSDDVYLSSDKLVNFTLHYCPGVTIADLRWTPESPTTEDLISFDMLVDAGSGETIAHTTWNTGDGAVLGGAEVEHQYPVADTYDVSATAWNGCGQVDTRTESITIAPVSVVPLSLADYSYPIELKPGETVNITADVANTNDTAQVATLFLRDGWGALHDMIQRTIAANDIETNIPLSTTMTPADMNMTLYLYREE